MAITWWDASVSEDMGTLVRDYGVNSFKHFMAYKSAIMCDDETLVNSFKRCREVGALATLHAENGELVYTLKQDIYDKGIHGPRGTAVPPRGGGRGRQPGRRIAEVLGVPSIWCAPPASTRWRPWARPATRASRSSRRCSPTPRHR